MIEHQRHLLARGHIGAVRCGIVPAAGEAVGVLRHAGDNHAVGVAQAGDSDGHPRAIFGRGGWQWRRGERQRGQRA
jgi:hypothetical protein